MSLIPQSVLLWKTVAVAAVVFTVFWVGRGHGIQLQTERTAKTIQAKNEALRKAGDALSAAVRTFRHIDQQTRLAQEQSEQWQLAAGVADQQGRDGRKRLNQRIQEMASEAEREKSNCSEARMRICGVPLR